MRLVYLDEAGIDAKSPMLAVSGVLVHGDSQYAEVNRRILKLVDKYVLTQKGRATTIKERDIRSHQIIDCVLCWFAKHLLESRITQQIIVV